MTTILRPLFVLCLLIAALAAPVGALRAQDMPPATQEDKDWINASLVRAQELIDQGDLDLAYDVIARANDYTFERNFDPYAEKWLPNFLFAKFYRTFDKRDWSEVERFAASVTAGLDTPEFRDRPERIEAALLLGEALAADERWVEAEPIVEGAFRDSIGVWGLENVHIRAAYTRAELKSLLDREDAEKARQVAFDFYVPGGPVEDYEYAFLRYYNLNALHTKHRYTNTQMLADEAQSFLDYLTGDVEVTGADKSFYRGFAALLLYENSQYDDALQIWRARQAYLGELGVFNREYFLGGQRLAGVLIATERYSEASLTLQGYIDEADREGYAERDIVALFYRDLAYIAGVYDQPETAQLYYRKAYAETRRVRSANHPDALALKAEINTTAPDIANFAFAIELGAEANTMFQVLPDASDTARMFLEGNYLALEALLEGLNHTDPAVLLNRAMAAAFLGDYTAMKSYLEQARQTARTTQGGPIAANAPYFDMIEVLGTVWGTSHRTQDAKGPLARLAARQATLTPSERNLYLALELMKVFQEGNEPLTRQALQTWLDQYDPTRVQNVWDAFALMIGTEVGFTQLEPEKAIPLYDVAIEVLATMPSLVLAREYTEFVRYLNGIGFTESDEGLAAMGALVASIRPRVPPDHVLQTSTQFGFASALWRRERHDEAFKAMQSAAEFYRSNPYYRKDILAFLLAQQSLLLVVQGKTELGVAIARETYEEIDFLTARSDLALTVISNYVYALRTFGDAENAAKIARTHVEDNAFMETLVYHQAAELLINLGAAEASLGDTEAARRAFVEAEAVIPKDRFAARLMLSRVAYQRGWLEYSTDNLPEAFHQLSRASQEYQTYRAEIARQQTSGQVAEHTEGLFLLSEEANAGWDYAQELKAAE